MKNFTVAGAAAKLWLLLGLSIMTVPLSCEKHTEDEDPLSSKLSLSELAGIFSALPLEQEHLEEVFSAVSSSSANGYDEEYTMSQLFSAPGEGVGGSEVKSGQWSYPLRELLKEHVRVNYATKAGPSADEYLQAIMDSDAQIYWPYSSSWDGKTPPIITFDPGVEALSNVGWFRREDGVVEELVVTEKMAMERPVWVINSNDDSAYTSLELLRRQDPSWGSGGSIIVSPKRSGAGFSETGTSSTRAGGEASPVPLDSEEKKVKSLLLKDFTMIRHYDCWFAGASEFFVKCGAVEDFTASTEAELRLYVPSITDFMISVKRSQLGQKLPFNALLVSEWTEQLENMALMITEDDGGTRTSWNCSAMVKIKSKSYGFDISLPFNSRDDIVWRGQVSRKYFEAYNDVEGHFGDVYLTFEIL